MITDKEAREEILALVNENLEVIHQQMGVITRARAGGNTSLDQRARATESAMVRWQEILVYARKRL